MRSAPGLRAGTHGYLDGARRQMARRGAAAVVEAPLRAVRGARRVRRGGGAGARAQPRAVVARQAARRLPRHRAQAQHQPHALRPFLHGAVVDLIYRTNDTYLVLTYTSLTLIASDFCHNGLYSDTSNF